MDETYLKGKSRSKRYADSHATTPKRKKLTQDVRLDRMKSLEDDMGHISERIAYKEKRRRLAEGLKNYKACDELTEEIAALAKEHRELEVELKELHRRDKRSKWYHSKRDAQLHHLLQTSPAEVQHAVHSLYLTHLMHLTVTIRVIIQHQCMKTHQRLLVSSIIE